MQELDGRTGYSILDLGPARGVNIGYWSQFGCRIWIEDLFRSIPIPVTAAEEDENAAVDGIFDDILDYGANTRFDVILAWDLFNYVGPQQLEALVHRLTFFCHSGTYLFALISNLQRIPAEPIVFKIVDAEQMVYETTSVATRPCPRYQPRDIARLMARFRVAGSFLLRHGMQEYVFVCEKPGK
jgi:hypothetical protein